MAPFLRAMTASVGDYHHVPTEPSPRPLRIAYYCSGHGYGHATRVSAFTRHLLNLSPPHRPTVHIVSSAPAHIFSDSIAQGAIYRHAEIDPVVVQPLAYSVDRQRSIEALQLFLSKKESKLVIEREWLTNTLKADCVLSDAAFLGCLAAKASKIPSILITNFTFDSVYSYLSTPLSDSTYVPPSPFPPSTPPNSLNHNLSTRSLNHELSSLHLHQPRPPATTNINNTNNTQHDTPISLSQTPTHTYFASPNPNTTDTDTDTPIPASTLEPLVSQIHEGYQCADMLLLLPGSIPIPSFTGSTLWLRSKSQSPPIEDSRTEINESRAEEAQFKFIIPELTTLPATNWIDPFSNRFTDPLLQVMLDQHGRILVQDQGHTNSTHSCSESQLRLHGITGDVNDEFGHLSLSSSLDLPPSSGIAASSPLPPPKALAPHTRPIIPTPLLVRPPSSTRVYTPHGRRGFLLSIGVPEYIVDEDAYEYESATRGNEIHDNNMNGNGKRKGLKILIVCFGGQVFKRPKVGRDGRSEGAKGGNGASHGPARGRDATMMYGNTNAKDHGAGYECEGRRTVNGKMGGHTSKGSHHYRTREEDRSQALCVGTEVTLDRVDTDIDTVHEEGLKTLLPDESWVAIICGVSKPKGDEEDSLPERFFIAPKDVYMPDLMAIGDVLLGKLGYGTVSESVDTCTPFVYVSRPLFIEEHGLRLLLSHEGTAIELSREDYENGNWASAVTEAWTRGCHHKLRKRLGMRRHGDGYHTRQRQEGDDMARFVIEWTREWSGSHNLY